ncbi:hypothetical protein BJ166DRAFT_583039 [Pestalotiopsis sp. NC0098]|nr:hypothetical protein BJ166DRAFT_583039 [Pestalotiopsis sp. NC0098]
MGKEYGHLEVGSDIPTKTPEEHGWILLASGTATRLGLGGSVEEFSIISGHIDIRANSRVTPLVLPVSKIRKEVTSTASHRQGRAASLSVCLYSGVSPDLTKALRNPRVDHPITVDRSRKRRDSIIFYLSTVSSMGHVLRGERKKMPVTLRGSVILACLFEHEGSVLQRSGHLSVIPPHVGSQSVKPKADDHNHFGMKKRDLDHGISAARLLLPSDVMLQEDKKGTRGWQCLFSARARAPLRNAEIVESQAQKPQGFYAYWQSSIPFRLRAPEATSMS